MRLLLFLLIAHIWIEWQMTVVRLRIWFASRKFASQKFMLLVMEWKIAKKKRGFSEKV